MFAWDPRFAMGPESSAIAARVWPRFLFEDSDVPEPGLQLELDESEFLRRYPAWGLRSPDGRLAAYMNGVLLEEDAQAGSYDDRGWTYAIEAAAKAKNPNCLCLVAANVDPEVQKLGVSKLLLEHAKAEARAAGFRFMLAPVRPSHRQERNDLAFEAYAELRREDGQLSDPWLRAHEKAGGRQVNICLSSAMVRASVARWSEWTARTYEATGSYSLEGGLAPLEMDLERGIGIYTEPNVWFRYDLTLSNNP